LGLIDNLAHLTIDESTDEEIWCEISKKDLPTQLISSRKCNLALKVFMKLVMIINRKEQFSPKESLRRNLMKIIRLPWNIVRSFNI
jgi:hypothetical protein